MVINLSPYSTWWRWKEIPELQAPSIAILGLAKFCSKKLLLRKVAQKGQYDWITYVRPIARTSKRVIQQDDLQRGERFQVHQNIASNVVKHYCQLFITWRTILHWVPGLQAACSVLRETWMGSLEFVGLRVLVESFISTLSMPSCDYHAAGPREELHTL